MPRTRIVVASFAVACIASSPLSAQEQDAEGSGAAATVTYLYGFNWQPGSAKRDVLTVEYGNAWRYGDNYFLFESYEMLAVRDPDSAGPTPSIYAEWHPRISLTKIFDDRLAFGPVTNVSLAGELNLANEFEVVLFGLGVDWRMPGSGWLFTNFYQRDDRALQGSTWHVLVAGGGDIPVAAQRLTLFGYVDAFGREGSRSGLVYGELQILLDLGQLFRGSRGRLWAGWELHVSQNAFGSDSGTEFVPQLALKWGL